MGYQRSWRIVQQYNHDFSETLDDKEMSVEDRKFMKIIEYSELQEGHFNIDLPFRTENPVMPNNYQVAEQRLIGLKKRFKRNEKFKSDYTEFLEDVISKSHAEVVPQAELKRTDGRVWYIPHMPFFIQRKAPSGWFLIVAQHSKENT